MTPSGFRPLYPRKRCGGEHAGRTLRAAGGAIKLAGGRLEWRNQKLTAMPIVSKGVPSFLQQPAAARPSRLLLVQRPVTGRRDRGHGGLLEPAVPLAEATCRVCTYPSSSTVPVRRTHYSSKARAPGNHSASVTTWKAGRPGNGVDSRRYVFAPPSPATSVRPICLDLFGPTTSGGGGMIDPQTGEQLNPQQLSGSNPALVPEVADTKTAGVVFRPVDSSKGCSSRWTTTTSRSTRRSARWVARRFSIAASPGRPSSASTSLAMPTAPSCRSATCCEREPADH